VSKEVEAIADALFDPASARKLLVLRAADERNARVVGVVLTCERERRTAC
jgi:hypothetical protein